MLYSILQQAPAETTRYMVAGYAVIFTVMLLYILSMVIRTRKLERDLELLNEMEQEQKK